MLVSADEINKVLKISDSDVIEKGKKLFEQSKVRVSSFKYKNDEEYYSKSFVENDYIYEVNIAKVDSSFKYRCNCKESNNGAICRHLIASFFNLFANKEAYLSVKEDLNKQEEKPVIKEFTKISDFIYKENSSLVRYYEELNKEKLENSLNVNLVPVINASDDNLSVSFEIGKEVMYKINDLNEFVNCCINKKIFEYGKHLKFIHSINNFNKKSQVVVNFLVKKLREYFFYMSQNNGSAKYKSRINLAYGVLDDFFDAFVNEQVASSGIISIQFLEQDPDIKISIKDIGDYTEISTKNNNYMIYSGENYDYVLYGYKLYRCSEEYKNTICPILFEIKFNGENKALIPKESCGSFCEYALSKIANFPHISIDNDVKDKYMPDNLVVKTYLDVDKILNITCDVKFCYKDIEFNPFDKNVKINVNRNRVKENIANSIFLDNHFILNAKELKLYLTNDEDIFEFFQKGINTFKKEFEVYVTDKLKQNQILRPKNISMGVKIKNNLLNLNFSSDDISYEELKEVLKAYKLKKKFYRLKEGEFVDLESDGIANLKNVIDELDAKVSESDTTAQKFRALSLSKYASDAGIRVKSDKAFKNVVRDITNCKDLYFEIPSNFKGTLRDYQKRGYNFLKILDMYNFGGILADEMGLGKTIQVIALLLDEKNSNSNTTSIVVCPSSLYLNWEKEIKKFAPDLKVLVVNGVKNERVEKINQMKNYDVVITSYDMLKRDIEYFETADFRYIIADEAQYIKNNVTKNSKALKSLNGKTKIALTGTPIENSLSELWSIFDFCMPGFLYTYKMFKEKYERHIIKDHNKEYFEKLREQVKPFILRRLKTDVLKELPEKIETSVYSDMEDEQRKIYDAYLLKARRDVQSIVSDGFENNRIQILAIITRLRQICCHPSLFISNYNGMSSKLSQCIDIVTECINSDHKILLFSQFTSMLDIIKEEFDKNNIKYMELTGKIKSDTRLELADNFNNKDDVKVFLISLKAGGTGLNLVGADIVIHFDPWWNLSVQNQATDRAHRIGQKNKVQVYKLICENSIEEKIEKLQQEKQHMADSVVVSGETFINKMSKEEILSLFEP